MNIRHTLFVEYLLSLNASKAAIKAGYKQAYGAALLQNPSVQSMLNQAQIEIRAKWHCKIDELMKSNNAIATASLRDFVMSDSTNGHTYLKDMSEIPSSKIQALSSLEVDEHGRLLKIKFKDKIKAIDDSMNRMGVKGTDSALDSAELNTLIRDEYAQVSELRRLLQAERRALSAERKLMQREHQSAMVSLDRKLRNVRPNSVMMH